MTHGRPSPTLSSLLLASLPVLRPTSCCLTIGARVLFDAVQTQPWTMWAPFLVLELQKIVPTKNVRNAVLCLLVEQEPRGSGTVWDRRRAAWSSPSRTTHRACFCLLGWTGATGRLPMSCSAVVWRGLPSHDHSGSKQMSQSSQGISDTTASRCRRK